MEVERRPACYRVAADKASGKCCVHHFAGGWNKMVSRCRPAGKFRSHQSENEAIWEKKIKKRMFEKSVSAVPGLAASFCLTSTSQLPRSGFLSLWFTSVFRPSSGFTFLSFCPRFLLFSALLFWRRESRKQRVPPASANATPQDWGLIDKSASPWTTTKHLYVRCFLWSPCSQAVQSPFKLFLFNLIVSAPFIFISSRSLGWTLARSGDRLEHFRMSFRWNLEV